MTTVSFNTTNVQSLDNIGKLYKIDVPLSEGSAAGEALVYSTSIVTNGRPAPTNAVILTNDDSDSSYFSIVRPSNSKLSLVAAGGSLNLYVYSGPTDVNGNVGSIEKYSFNAQGVLQTQDTLTNPLDIAYEEQQSSRDLDGNAVVGGALNANGTLDKTGSLYQVNVAGQNMFIVGTTVTAKSKTIDVDSTVLKIGAVEEPADQKAWQPEEAYTSYSAVRSDEGGWDVFAYQASSDSVTQFSFDSNNLLKSDYVEGQVLKASEVASLEKQLGRNLNGDVWFGANIAASAIDSVGGLFKASIQGEDFFVVGANLKASTKALGAVDLSSSLTTETGEQAWNEPEGYTIKSVVKNLNDDSLQVYLTPPTYNSETYKVLRFDFQLNQDSGNYQLDVENTDGVELSPFELAKAEKLSRRDLDKTYKFLSSPSQTQDEFGVSIVRNLDNVGGLYHATSLGQSYLIAGKNLVSNAKKITDLTNALTIDGMAWTPDGFSASELQGKVSIVINPNNALQADVYVKESDGFTKYEFTRSDVDTPWSTTGSKEVLSAEEIAAVEKSTKRDLNYDGFFGARITELKNAPGGLYSVTYGDLGTTSTLATSDTQKIFLRSDVKLALGSTVAKNAVDFSNALRSSEGFWSPPEGYQIRGAYKDAAAEQYTVIVAKSPADFLKFTFDISGDQTQLIETGEGSSNAISTPELAALEVTYKRDLNGDGITGVRILQTSDKVGGLFKVEAADGDYYVNKVGSAPVNNLQNAFFDESMNGWAPSKAEGTSITKLTLVQTTNADTQADEFLIYQKEVGSSNVYSKYTFNENRQLIDKAQLSLVDLANEEATATRDINGDGVIGAKVIAPVDKNGGLYKVSLEDKFLLVAVNPASAPGRQINLQNVLLSAEGNPLEINQAGVFQNGDLAGWKVNASVRVTDDEGKITTKVFALKSNSEGVIEVKRLNFEESSDSTDFANYKMLVSNDTLNAQDLIAEETNLTYGKDLNLDKAVGLKIDQTIDKKVGLYSATVLGQNYYFFDEVNKKTGTSAGNAIDLSRAFYDSDAKPWAMPPKEPDEEPTKLAGLVKNVDADGDVVGYDIFTYNQKTVSGEFNVQKHSWTWDTNTGLVYKGSAAADAAELVEVEKVNLRDLSGDGIVGFKLVGRSDVNDKYEGVTKATVFGNDTFFVVGKNLKPGTPSNPWKLSDALLSEDGTSAWSIPNIPVALGSDINLNKMITAVRDIANSTDRFVYVKYSKADESQDYFIQKYKFDKSTGKYSGESEKLDSITFAAEEINYKRDLNNDGKLGVYSFSDVKLSTSTPGEGYTDIFSGQGKSSGLIKTTVNNIDYLVVKKLPNSNTLLNLDLALVNADGTAWKPSENFLLKGVYKNSATQETEIYGYEPIDDEANEPDYSLKKYQFTIEDFSPNDDPFEATPNGTTPKVLKLKSDPAAGYMSVSDLVVSERENTIGKDLNNDNVVGLKIATNPIATIPTGTGIGSIEISDSATVDASRTSIYVVGKSLSTMGAIASRTANQHALRKVDNEGNLSYWKPDPGYSIQAILESANSIKVYAKDESDITKLQEYTFAKDDSVETTGWNFESETLLTNSQLVSLEVSNYRDLNGDNTMGLTYESTQAIQGMFTGRLNDEVFYFAGQATRSIVNGTSPFGIDSSKLLKDEDGNAWRPADADAYTSFSSIASDEDRPDTAAFALRGANVPRVFFNSQNELVPS